MSVNIYNVLLKKKTIDIYEGEMRVKKGGIVSEVVGILNEREDCLSYGIEEINRVISDKRNN